MQINFLIKNLENKNTVCYAYFLGWQFNPI